MINTKTLKLDCKKKDKYEHYESISDELKQDLLIDIKECEDAIQKLNITEEIRNKKTVDLTEEEKDKLYDEYVYNSIISSSKSLIEHGARDIKYLLQEIEEKYGVRKW